jgi:hypothetical protein
MTAGRRGRGPLPARKMVAAEHNILEKQRCSHMETSGSADLFGCTVAVHAGDLVMSSSGRASKMPEPWRDSSYGFVSLGFQTGKGGAVFQQARHSFWQDRPTGCLHTYQISDDEVGCGT